MISTKTSTITRKKKTQQAGHLVITHVVVFRHFKIPYFLDDQIKIREQENTQKQKEHKRKAQKIC